MSNSPIKRKWERNISVRPRPEAKSQMNTQWSPPTVRRAPLSDVKMRTFNLVKKRKSIIFEDQHPFTKTVKLRELFPGSKKMITINTEQIGYRKCKNVQQLFIMLCLSSIKKKLGNDKYVLMSADDWDRRLNRVEKTNEEMSLDCNAYFVDLDGLNPVPIIHRHDSGKVMRTQMDKLEHIQRVLSRSSNNKIIVGFIQANAESMEYSCLRPEVVKSGRALDNLMVTSIGLNVQDHIKIVNREWFRGKRKKLLEKMNGRLYLDVSEQFKEDCNRDISVSIYIRKQRESNGEVKGEKLDQICKPIKNQTEALSAFESGMKITRVNWLQRKAGHMSTVELDAKPFDWDYLTPLREDKSFLSALERIYHNKEA